MHRHVCSACAIRTSANIVNLLVGVRKRKEVVEQREAWDIQELANQFHSSDFTPGLKSVLQSGMVFPGTQTVTAWLEMPGDEARSAERKRCASWII
jgi:hypothetical protein